MIVLRAAQPARLPCRHMPLLKFRNYQAASRKRNMIAFGLYRQDASADLDVIEDVGSGKLGFTGTQDGQNTVFTLSAVPSDSNLVIVKNGLVLKSGAGNDYTLSGATVTLATPPYADDAIQAIAIG